MDYFGLTTTAQIRNILTAGDADITLEKIESQNLEDDLGAALDAALPTWEAVKDDAEKPANQRRLRLFAKYFCAGTLALTAQAFLLKKISDGSNEGQRSDKDGWAFLAIGFMAKAKAAMDQVNEDLGLTPVYQPMSIISRVVPDRDPITQPRATSGS